MPTVDASDGTRIHYKDWGEGQPVVFSHGWPLSADAVEDQMMFLASRGLRTIAHDRRGHGRSDQPFGGYDYDTFADDLATLLDTLDLKDAVLVGHSMGGGEVARYIGRHGTARVDKAVLIAAVTPMMLQTPRNPEGTPMKAFDAIRTALLADRAQFFKDVAIPFYGYNREGAQRSEGVLENFWRQGAMASIAGTYQCVAAFSETDFAADLAKFDVPTLFIHGDDDQIVPLAAAATRAAPMVKGAELLVYEGAPHGLMTTLKDRVNADLLAFISHGTVHSSRVAA